MKLIKALKLVQIKKENLLVPLLYICLLSQFSFGQSTINFFPKDHFFSKKSQNQTRKGNITEHNNVWPKLISKKLVDSLNILNSINLKETEEKKLSLIPNIEFVSGYDLTTGTKENLSFWTFLAPTINYEINKKLSLNAGLQITSGNFWPGLNRHIDKNFILPGNNKVQKNGIVRSSYTPIGHISYSPNKIFNFQIGQNKHFIGHGYRSVILSHNAAPFPYARIQTHLKRFQYTNLFGSFHHFEKENSKIQQTRRKFTANHILSWNVHKNFNLYFFEAIVWPNKDSTYHRGFDLNYLNPLVFYRPIEYSIGSSDNALMGVGYNLIISPQIRLYGQFVIDEFLLSEINSDIKHFLNPKDTSVKHGWWANKYALQLGFKFIDSLHSGVLKIIGEINLARPFTYTHGTVTQSYTHANQPLAHPLGTNFFESLLIAQYSHKNWILKTKGIFSYFGRETGTENLGGSILIPYTTASKIYGNSLGQGNRNDVWQFEVELSYPIFANPKISILAGYYLRKQKSEFSSVDLYYPFIGLRMGSILRYTDF